jgi:polysaccharide pyruvyl transferase WcaK-like protein
MPLAQILQQNVRVKPKVAVLTYHYTTNYGAVLQAYALAQFLSALGYSCNIIDYRPWTAITVYAKALFLNCDFISGMVKYYRFSKFIHNKLPITPQSTHRPADIYNIVSKYQVLIVGSDEVWKTNSFRGFDPAFFLEFASLSQIKISFSASAGGSKSFAEHKQEVCKLLSTFHAVSVRDDSSATILDNECGIQSTRLIDPTLLIDFPKESTKNIFDYEYILIYAVLTKSEMLTVQKMAHDSNCKIVSVGYRNYHADKNILGAGIEDWIELFRAAKSVFTTFFHGAIFALKFHREVFILSRPEKDYKINQLINDLQLTSDDLSSLKFMLNENKIYRLGFSESTEQLIQSGREAATNFLNTAIAESLSERQENGSSQ